MSAYSNWFDGLYVNHTRKMRIVAYRSLNDMEAADDVVHSTFLVLLSKGREMMNHPNPQAWLYKTMSNLIMNEKKLARNWREISIESIPNTLARVDTYFSFEDYLPHGLSEDERMILRMYYAEQESYENIAAHFEKSVSACRTRLCRAKAHCAELMEVTNKLEISCNVSAK